MVEEEEEEGEEGEKILGREWWRRRGSDFAVCFEAVGLLD